MRRSLTVMATLFVVSLVATADSERFGKVVNGMVKAINEGDYARIGSDFDRTMEDFFPPEKREPFFKNLSAQYGKIIRLDKPRLVQPGQAIFVANCERGKLDIKVWMDEKDKIIGLLFLPHTADIPVPEKHQTKLSLPFRGRWLVFWGGDTKELNQHHDVPNQRFAFDFLGVDEKGNTRRGQAQINEDYFAFAREISAPADGVVTRVGMQGGYGKMITIDHGFGSKTRYGHISKAMVKVGAKVKRGQMIALVGNTGRSTGPHLHYEIHVNGLPVNPKRYILD